MAIINFKSVGELSTSRKFTQAEELTPIGIKTPMEISQGSEGIFSMHYSIEDQIQDNLRNLILTNRGERLGRYDYGADLQELAFELGSDRADTEAVMRISRAIKKYMSFIEPETFAASSDRNHVEHTAKIRIRLTYNVPTLGIKNKAIEVTLYAAG